MQTDMKTSHNCLICYKELPEMDIACILINKFERGHAILVCPDCNGGKMAITVSLNGAPKERAEKPWKVDWSKITLAEKEMMQEPDDYVLPEKLEKLEEDPNYTEVLDDDEPNIQIPR